jgi:hypothetical protein
MSVGTTKIAEALARSAGGNSRNNMAVPTGVIMPPPTPWMKRNNESSARECAWPQSTDAAVKVKRAKRKIRFVPNLSPSQPDAGIQIASERR